VLKPQIIIAMMGIKDTPNEWVPVAAPLPNWTQSLRTVKLLSWLIEDMKLRKNANITDVQTFADLPASAQRQRTSYGNYIRELRVASDNYALDREMAAVYLYQIGRVSEAEAILRELVASRGMGYTMLSDLIAGKGRYDEAFALLDDAIAKHPDEGLYRVQLARLRLRQKEFDTARAILAEATQLSDTFFQTDLVRQFILLESSELALALRQAEGRSRRHAASPLQVADEAAAGGQRAQRLGPVLPRAQARGSPVLSGQPDARQRGAPRRVDARRRGAARRALQAVARGRCRLACAHGGKISPRWRYACSGGHRGGCRRDGADNPCPGTLRSAGRAPLPTGHHCERASLVLASAIAARKEKNGRSI